jgi:hypothetical protein
MVLTIISIERHFQSVSHTSKFPMPRHSLAVSKKALKTTTRFVNILKESETSKSLPTSNLSPAQSVTYLAPRSVTAPMHQIEPHRSGLAWLSPLLRF